jgi:hypothetical protein
MAERTGCPVLLSLWSYVKGISLFQLIKSLKMRIRGVGHSLKTSASVPHTNTQHNCLWLKDPYNLRTQGVA